MAPDEEAPKPIVLFYSYSHLDEKYREALGNHLETLRQSGIIIEWHDRKISPGADWDQEIQENLKNADVILILLSADFFGSQYCINEAEKALEKHTAGKAVLIPIIIRPVFWEITRYHKLQALPKDARPVSDWRPMDKAYVDICRGILKCVISLQSQKDFADSSASKTVKTLTPETAEKLSRRKVLDAAVPEKATVNKAMALMAMIRAQKSEGLRKILQINTEYEIDEKEIVSTLTFPLKFPVNEAGEPQPLELHIKIESPDFEPKTQTECISISPDGDSEPLVCLLNPQNTGELPINLKLYNGESLISHCLLKTVASTEAGQNAKANLTTIPVNLEIIPESESTSEKDVTLSLSDENPDPALLTIPLSKIIVGSFSKIIAGVKPNGIKILAFSTSFLSIGLFFYQQFFNQQSTLDSPTRLRFITFAGIVLLMFSAALLIILFSRKRKIMSESKLPTDEKNVEQMKSEEALKAQAKEIILRRNLPPEKNLPPEEILALAKNLKNYKSFSYARRILKIAAQDLQVDADQKTKLKIFQQWALCTYKDNDLPIDLRLDMALKILGDVENIDTTTNQETLGIIGAIYKRKWEVDNQKIQLERALLYYRRGNLEGAEKDYGYTGINEAFVLDWLAFQEESEARLAKIESLAANVRRERAQEIRKGIIAKVTPLADDPQNDWLKTSWWYYSTLAEAHFGLLQYDEAVKCMEEGKANIGKIPEWEEESTLTQLARLAVFQSDAALAGDEFKKTPAYDALKKVFGDYPAAVRNAFNGKIGLALSGGGFRASLYHIGTLAKLAELDVLRHIEVLSCVSGGSIIGAHYYLKIRKLLEEKEDGLEENLEEKEAEKYISKDDYIKVVEEIVEEFLDGVQRNIRVRIAAEFTTNLKMILPSKYSRTMRAGELYEEEIFSKICDGEGAKPRFMDELNIYPKDDISGRSFNPKLNNWRRAAKVPMLVLNATTLNTGHNWQFTTTWMGEPPSSIDTEVDTNDRLRRMYYSEAPPEHRKIRLGHAVSASAGVPGLFAPLALKNLYPDRIVRLVDGGVCDNQGVNSLLEQDCTVILVSDGSGQMVSQNTPGSGVIRVPLRTNSILQSRIRDVQYHDLVKRKRSSLLRGLMFIHLKEELASDPIDWVNCPDPGEKKLLNDLAEYGISKDIQQCLAATRTDLDSFSEIEAYALMTSGYRMTEDAFVNKKCIEGFSDKNHTIKWKFLDIEDSINKPSENYRYVKKLLGTSSSMVFKVWRQSPFLEGSLSFLGSLLKYLKSAALVLGGPLIMFLVWLVFTYPQQTLIDLTIKLGGVGKWVLVIIIASVVIYPLGISLLGWIAAHLHLRIFDRMFLKYGKLDSLPDRKKSQ